MAACRKKKIITHKINAEVFTLFYGLEILTGMIV
jgi:hypothetical protein